MLAVAENAALDGITIRDNHISIEGGGGWETGIRVNAGEPGVDDVSIVGNSVRGATDGVTFRGAGFRRTPVCALNQMDAGVVRPLVGLNQLPERTVLTGGAAGRGGADPGTGTGRHLTGIGDPTGTVLGNVGDVYLRVDGAPGETFYVKRSRRQHGHGLDREVGPPAPGAPSCRPGGLDLLTGRSPDAAGDDPLVGGQVARRSPPGPVRRIPVRSAP